MGQAEAGSIPPARAPGRWADAQRDLALRSANGETLPATPVLVRWWTSPETWMPRYGGWPVMPIAAVQGVRMLARRVRRGPAGTFVALWRQGTESAAPDLVFRADPDELPSMDGSANGTLLGEYAPNGALLVDFGSKRIRPTYNPQRPHGDVTRGLRSSIR